MQTTLWLYGRLLGIFVALSLVVVFNITVWGLHRQPASPVWYVPGTSPERGAKLLQAYGCGACHTVPGVPGATGQVGPPLDRIPRQMYIAGVLPNTPENLALWIAHPRQVDPRTAMPDLPVTDEEARDIAAYLYGAR